MMYLPSRHSADLQRPSGRQRTRRRRRVATTWCVLYCCSQSLLPSSSAFHAPPSRLRTKNKRWRTPTTFVHTDVERETDETYATIPKNDSDVVLNVDMVEPSSFAKNLTETLPLNGRTAPSYSARNGHRLNATTTVDVTEHTAVFKNGQEPKNGQQAPPDSSSPPPPSSPTTIRSMWRRRNARTAEEGIRREKVTTQLSSLLSKAESIFGGTTKVGRQYGARTIMGLIHALADEVDDLNVQVQARADTPFWGKHVDAVRIQFSRLGFKPLRMGGLDQAISEWDNQFPEEKGALVGGQELADLECADEAFDRIDVDKSGALDRDEIAGALNHAARHQSTDGTNSEADERKNMEFLRHLATELVNLYDFNGDGVVDRTEYQLMVEDMAALRDAQEEKRLEEEETEDDSQEESESEKNEGWFSPIVHFVQRLFRRGDNAETEEEDDATGAADFDGSTGRPPISKEYKVVSTTDKSIRINGDAQEGDQDSANASRLASTSTVVGAIGSRSDLGNGRSSVIDSLEVVNVTDAPLDYSVAKAVGAITLSDLKLDLRRLVFGVIPILKHITPGGPLILEPFTATVEGSFNRNDIMQSSLLDAGLRRLVAIALRRRVRSLRDFMDGAVFHGRNWKMSSASAPVVEVVEISNIEFDDQDRMIVTGRVRVKTRKEVPMVENSFKLRTRLGTRRGGRTIKLVDPELALVIDCPDAWENGINEMRTLFGQEKLPHPDPLYFFFPIYSPFQLADNDGFYLGEDNRIKSVYVQDKALRFELSAVLRPGRFLGNHYLAFTLPKRTFIITLDRVKEGIRAARRMKKAAAKAIKDSQHENEIPVTSSKLRQVLDNNDSIQEQKPKQTKRAPPKSFFSRFVDGYLQSDRDENSSGARMTAAIRDFFGRQGTSNGSSSATSKSPDNLTPTDEGQ